MKVNKEGVPLSRFEIFFCGENSVTVKILEG